jgi:replication factor C subunit 2/4
LELNASDERGISVIREKIKAFAKLTVAQKEGMPQFKVVILDECDSLTSEAQAALRRTMEVFSRHTRFILICNYISRIIEPLSSRCAKFRFKPLPREVCVGKLKQICDCEKLSIETAILEKICDGCDGDLRRCITLLQTLKGNYDLIDDCLGVIPENVVVDVYLKQGNIDHVLMNGYSPFQLVLQVFDYIQMEPTMSNKEKSLIAAKLAVVEKCLIDGASSRLQLLDLFYFCKSIMASA